MQKHQKKPSIDELINDATNRSNSIVSKPHKRPTNSSDDCQPNGREEPDRYIPDIER